MGLTPTRKIAIGATLAATAVALTGIGIAVAPSSSAAAACGVLFDDFNYSSRTDAALGQRGWSVRSTSGGPGVAGARWIADNVSFPTVDGQKVADGLKSPYHLVVDFGPAALQHKITVVARAPKSSKRVQWTETINQGMLPLSVRVKPVDVSTGAFEVETTAPAGDPVAREPQARW